MGKESRWPRDVVRRISPRESFSSDALCLLCSWSEFEGSLFLIAAHFLDHFSWGVENHFRHHNQEMLVVQAIKS